ncbi:MAG: 50S ribosomal protein L24 [Nanoarchaeota archaeon]
MKKLFSTSWKSSRQPRKQRKYVFNAPLHIRHKLVSANLSKELRKKYGKRSFPLRKGDNVKIMVGEFKKKLGKIVSVDLKRLRISIEGIQRTKKDGSKVNVWFDSSNLQIQELNLEDKKRINAISRGKNKQEQEKK